MIVEIFAAKTVAMSVRIVSPAEDARIRDVAREEVAEPMDVVRRCPSLVAVSIQPMDGDNTTNNQRQSTNSIGGLLDNRLISFYHNVETTGNTFWRFLRRAISLLRILA